jgi:hydroxymethylglutaryl-CoA lyase
MSLTPKRVSIVDVGPRDGLQNEKTPIATHVKVQLIEQLAHAGVRRIEAASFVSPKWVPQMADGGQVLADLHRTPGVEYSALTPNVIGFDRALAAKVDAVGIFAAASEAFSQKNINCTIAESIERFVPLAKAAASHKMLLRAAVSCSLGCPYQGDVPIADVVEVVKRLRDLGADEIGVADTIGVGTAGHTKRLFEACAKEFPVERLVGHFHDTYGQALANTLAALEVGVTVFDTSVGGLGGCPFAKGATGNVATEDVVYMLHGMGIETGIDLHALIETGMWISDQISKPYGSRAGRALHTRRQSQIAVSGRPA